MKKLTYSTAMLLLMGSTATTTVYAENFNGQLSIKPSLDVTAGIFYSDKSYNNPAADDHVAWQEAYAKYGLTADYKFQNSALYASLQGLSSGTFGDGDSGGMTDGTERKTSLEEWVLGWRTGGNTDPKIDFSLGRQNVQIADGFLVAGDALNAGNGIAEGELNRGGGYYLAARKSFDFTSVLHYQLTDALKTHWYYLESDNKAQYEPTLWATDWQYNLGSTDLGFTYLGILDIKDPLKESVREDLKDIAMRGKVQLTEQLGFNAEYVYQDQKNTHENAWYAALNYTFDQVPYQPTLGYRFSSFSEDYDSLFYGNTDAGFGTWFQGEVAANYAGPYSTNTRIHQISLQASVKENLHLGLLAYQFDTIKKDNENLDGHELDLFGIWSPTNHINVIPVLGFYKPKKDITQGGTQVNGTDTNTYAQLLLQYVY